ncbi:MAG: DUF3153 domain-containing protein [Synechococcaceae cyanobacterium]
MAEDQLAASLEQAARWLERGDYGQVLRLLEPLAERHGPATALGGRLRLQIVTALMGQGDSQRAAAVCRSLTACRDSQLRSQARDLLLVLEAPALRRPPEWSLTLPALPDAEPLQGRALGRGGAGAKGPPPPPPPPVGPTRAPLGFALVVVLALLLLTNLLAGCVQVRSEFTFLGPGRMRISHQLASSSGQGSPWQQKLSADLISRGYRPSGRGARAGSGDRLESPVLPAERALASFGQDLLQATALAGLPLPPPRLELRERNWLVGVRQSLSLDLDLGPLGGLESADLSLALRPLNRRAVREATPLAVHSESAAGGARLTQIWPLQVGARNRLRVITWRWSPLGLGASLIGLLLALVLGLQRLRLALGFGPPQLPA